MWNAYANPLPERLSRKRVWGNKKRQVVEDEFDWPEKEVRNQDSPCLINFVTPGSITSANDSAGFQQEQDCVYLS